MSFCVPRWTLALTRGQCRLDDTWSFAGPDGRALFRLAEVAGETVVVWLRVGNHGIYDS